MTKMTKIEIEIKIREYASKAYKNSDSTTAEVKDRINTAIKELVALAMTMPYMGKDFVFGSNKKATNIIAELDSDIKKIITNSSDRAKKISDRLNRSLGLSITDWDNEEWINSTWHESNYDTRLHDYTTRLKKELELYVAIGMVKKMSQLGVIEWFMSNISNPHTNKEILDSNGYLSSAKSKILRIGKGGITSAWESIVRLNKDITDSSYHISNRFSWGGLKGKTVVTMGDSLVCKKCEANAGMVFRVDEWVVPAHNRCRCLEVPFIGH